MATGNRKRNNRPPRPLSRGLTIHHKTDGVKASSSYFSSGVSGGAGWGWAGSIHTFAFCLLGLTGQLFGSVVLLCPFGGACCQLVGVAPSETTGQQLCSRSQPPAGQPGIHALSWAIPRNQGSVRYSQASAYVMSAYLPLAGASPWPSPESESVGTHKGQGTGCIRYRKAMNTTCLS